jgi:hypothetical protein
MKNRRFSARTDIVISAAGADAIATNINADKANTQLLLLKFSQLHQRRKRDFCVGRIGFFPSRNTRWIHEILRYY